MVAHMRRRRPTPRTRALMAMPMDVQLMVGGYAKMGGILFASAAAWLHDWSCFAARKEFLAKRAEEAARTLQRVWRGAVVRRVPRMVAMVKAIACRELEPYAGSDKVMITIQWWRDFDRCVSLGCSSAAQWPRASEAVRYFAWYSDSSCGRFEFGHDLEDVDAARRFLERNLDLDIYIDVVACYKKAVENDILENYPDEEMAMVLIIPPSWAA